VERWSENVQLGADHPCEEKSIRRTVKRRQKIKERVRIRPGESLVSQAVEVVSSIARGGDFAKKNKGVAGRLGNYYREEGSSEKN